MTGKKPHCSVFRTSNTRRNLRFHSYCLISYLKKREPVFWSLVIGIYNF
jgi:hypothetical protein